MRREGEPSMTDQGSSHDDQTTRAFSVEKFAQVLQDKGVPAAHSLDLAASVRKLFASALQSLSGKEASALAQKAAADFHAGGNVPKLPALPIGSSKRPQVLSG